MHLEEGQTLNNGKYTIQRVLGQGGFGITYLATTTDNQQVAVKEFFMKDACVRDATTMHVSVPSQGAREEVDRYRKKFIKEANNLLHLHHPNIVQVYEVFEQNGTDYYAMQYLEGGSLRDNVMRYGPMDEYSAKSYILQVAEALRYMHEQKQICHYDVKPGNILMDTKGKAMLIDFGLAKNYDGSGQQTSSTPVGISAGYAPLEQYRQSLSEFSPATDVYALGATLYFLLSGQNPPEASVVLERGISCPADISANTWDAIRMAMIPARQERLQTVDDFCQILEYGIPEDPPLPVKRNRGWVWAVLALIAALAVVGIVLISSDGKKDSGQDYTATYVDSIVSAPEEEESPELPFATNYVSKQATYKNAQAKIVLDYPTQGPTALVDAIRGFILDKLTTDRVLRYSGDMTDGNAIAEYYVQQYVNNEAEDTDDFNVELEVELKKICETDLFVTYNDYSYSYEGGAHGFYGEGGITFRKSDGKIIKNVIRDTSNDKFKEMVIEGVKDQGVDVENLSEDFFANPLPRTDFFLSDKGVELRYQPYEIASYSQGLIAVTLYWGWVKDYLTSEARALCPVSLDD